MLVSLMPAELEHCIPCSRQLQRLRLSCPQHNHNTFCQACAGLDVAFLGELQVPLPRRLKVIWSAGQCADTRGEARSDVAKRATCRAILDWIILRTLPAYSVETARGIVRLSWINSARHTQHTLSSESSQFPAISSVRMRGLSPHCRRSTSNTHM